MNNRLWNDHEIEHLVTCIETLGMAQGIKAFRNDHPERSYNACYSKYSRVTSDNITEETSDVGEIPAVEVKITEAPVEENPVSFFTKIKMFFERLFSWRK